MLRFCVLVPCDELIPAKKPLYLSWPLFFCILLTDRKSMIWAVPVVQQPDSNNIQCSTEQILKYLNGSYTQQTFCHPSMGLLKEINTRFQRFYEQLFPVVASIQDTVSVSNSCIHLEKPYKICEITSINGRKIVKKVIIKIVTKICSF